MKKKLLLVDDSRSVLLMEQMCLQKEPYELSTAMDGETAVAKALADPPDLILLDVLMPRMSGLEALRLLRKAPQTQRVPVILVTTRSEAENLTAGFEQGCNDFVFKPIDPSELLAKVRDQLAR